MKTAIKLFLLGALAVTAMACTQKALDQTGQVSPVFTGGVAQATRAEGSLWYSDKVGIMTVAAPMSSMVSDYANVGYQTDASGVPLATFSVINAADDVVFENTEETVTFVSYAPYYESAITELPGQNKDGIITGNTQSQTTYDSQIALDYLFADERTGSESVPDIHFNFYHRMTQLIIKFTHGTGLDASDVKAGTYTLGGIVHDGEFNLDYNSSDFGTAYATGSTALSDWSLPDNWYVTTDGSDYDVCFTCIIYPQAPASLPLYAHVDATEYTGTDLLGSLPDGEFEAGCSYTFNITVSESDLEVTGSTITDWDSSSFDIDLSYGDDDDDTDYTSNVSWSLGEHAFDYTATVNGGDDSYEILKLGSGSAAGSATCTIPAGTTSLCFYAVAWSGCSDVSYTVTVGDTEYTYTCQGNSGFSGSGTSYDLTGVTDADYVVITFDEPLASDTTVTFATTATSSDYRVGLFGVNYYPSGDEGDDNEGDGSGGEGATGSIAYGTDSGVEVDADYSTNVTWASGTKAYDYSATVNGGSESYEILKLGSSSAVGSDTCTIPAGTTSFGYYVVAWNGCSDVPYQITIGDTVYTDVCQGNSGFSGSGSSYSLVGVSDSDYRLITFDPALTEDTIVTIETTSTSPDPRAGFFGVKYFPNDSGDDNSGNGSEVTTTGSGTAEDPYTIADVLALFEAGTATTLGDVYITGTVSEIGDLYSSGSYNELTYYLSDDGYTTSQFMIYEGKGLNGEDITSTSYLTVGDVVVVYGTLYTYNSTNEMKYGSTIISINGATSKEGDDEGDDEEEDETLVYGNDFDATIVSGTSTKLTGEQYKNEKGSGIANVTYDYSSNMTVRVTAASTGYEGASGNNNIFFGTDSPDYFTIQNITLPNAKQNFTLKFGVIEYNNTFSTDNFKVYISQDGEKWVKIDYTFEDGAPTSSTWGLASYSFTIPNDNRALYIYFEGDVTSTYHLDDVSLNYIDTSGTEINFDAGVTVPEGSDAVENEAYVANVTWTAVSSAEATDKVVIDGVTYENVLKFGTTSATGSGTCTLPAGATSFSFYCTGWSSTTVSFKVTLDGTEIITGTAPANSGVSGSSPFTLNSSAISDDNYFSATFTALSEATTLTFESTESGTGKRGIVFGAKYGTAN